MSDDGLTPEFTARWHDAMMLHGERPDLNQFFSRVTAADLPELAAELIPIDVERRLMEGDNVQDSDYASFGPEAVQVAATALAGAQELSAPLRLAPGDQLADRYTLRELLGQGGMGEVWLADQIYPVQRQVAVKVMRAPLGGSPSKDDLARFEIERQSLALMNHEHIAKVLDAGTTTGQKPFFVMEFVKGVPITKYCDEARLTVEERIQLMIAVCQAVQHAHQKGVIHRDLKPSNVLVAIADGKPVPKVIDFGLAKVSNLQVFTNLSLRTEFGQLLGTLQYMSPEQAELSPLDVDTRTDIYSLGVLLYELLTGVTPLDRVPSGKQALLQALKDIRETEPLLPSRRLSDTADSAKLIAGQRRIEPERLRRILVGELDWIVAKALEKDRLRRYESASGLAADLQRFLNDEPVEARPPSYAYRLRKVIRRHRVAVGFATALLVVLIGSTVGMAALTAWAFHERDQAVTAFVERDQAAGRAELALQENAKTQAKLEKEVQSTSSVLDVVLGGHDRFFREIMAEPQLKSPALSETRSRILVGLHDHYQAVVDALAVEARDDEPHLKRLAETYQNLGQTASELGNAADGAAAYTRARTIHERRRQLDSTNLDARIDLSNALYNLSLIANKSGETETALQLGQQSLAVIDEALATAPGDGSVEFQRFLSQVGYGTILLEAGQISAAETILKDAADSAVKFIGGNETRAAVEATMLVGALVNLGNLYADSSRFEDSQAQLMLALGFAQKLAKARSEEAVVQELLAGVHMNLGTLNQRIIMSRRGTQAAPGTNDTAMKEVVDHYRAARSILNQLRARDPYDQTIRVKLADAAQANGHFFMITRDYPAAEREFADAERLVEELLQEAPDSVPYLIEKAMILGNQTALYGEMGNQEQTRQKVLATCTLFEQLAAKDPKNLAFKVNLASAYGNVGQFALTELEYEEAQSWADKSVALSLECLQSIGKHPALVQTLANGFVTAVITRTQLKDFDDALRLVDEALGQQLGVNQNSLLALRCRLLLELQRPQEAFEILTSFGSLEGDDVGSRIWAVSLSRALEIVDNLKPEDLAGVELAKLESQVTERGINALQTALSLGSLNPATVHTSPDLRRLMATEELQKLNLGEPGK